MLTNQRLMDISADLKTAPEFFARLRSIVHGDAELQADLEAAPEFFNEMQQIVDELSRYRGLDAFKNEIRAVIPEAYKWTRPKRFFWEGIWDDIVNVAGK